MIDIVNLSESREIYLPHNSICSSDLTDCMVKFILTRLLLYIPTNFVIQVAYKVYVLLRFQKFHRGQPKHPGSLTGLLSTVCSKVCSTPLVLPMGIAHRPQRLVPFCKQDTV